MKTPLFLTVFCVLFLAPFKSIAQDQCPPEQRAAEGTYEFVYLTKIQEVFTADILCEIESRREINKTIDWQISEYTVVTIFSKKKLAADRDSK